MAKKIETKIDKIEREYVIPLRIEWKKVPRYKRAAKAIKAIREFLVRHMKIYDRDLNKIKIDKYLNEFVWFRGIKKPPVKVKVKAIREGEIVRVELFEFPKKLNFKKLREEKLEKKASEGKKDKRTMKEKVQDSVKKKPENETTMSEVPAKSELENKDKKAKEEKVKSSGDVTKKLEKAEAKKIKHSTGGKEKKKTQPQRKALKK